MTLRSTCAIAMAAFAMPAETPTIGQPLFFGKKVRKPVSLGT
jgi:hypothetical protein